MTILFDDIDFSRCSPDALSQPFSRKKTWSQPFSRKKTGVNHLVEKPGVNHLVEKPGVNHLVDKNPESTI